MELLGSYMKKKEQFENTENSISLYFYCKPIFRQPWSKRLGTREN